MIDWLINNAKDGSTLVLIPEGIFLAGNDVFPVFMPSYYLALHTVTNAQYSRFMNEVAPNVSEQNTWINLESECNIRQNNGGFESVPGKENHPVVNISWFGAKAYCTWSGLRLPSELEWEKGARGTDGRNYPWGDTWDEEKCRNANNRGDEDTCDVWSYPAGCSPWGCYQMEGNVWEWCEDWYKKDIYNQYEEGNLTSPQEGSTRVLRGGSWFICGSDFFRCARRGFIEPDICNSNYGFRCCATI
jgi:formylglycine-generating enzyme